MAEIAPPTVRAYPASLARRPARWSRLWLLARRKPLGAISLLIILIIVFAALAAEIISPYDPNQTFPGRQLQGPSASFLLGTDNFARDILSRIIYGARISLAVGVAAVIFGVAAGSLVGLVSGYLEGVTDLVVQRLLDALMSLPTLVLALAIVAAMGPGLLNVLVAIGISQIPLASRVARGSVLAEKQNVYVDAARIVGCGTPRILLRHLLPNITAPIVVLATVTLASAIILEATLSFLGVGLSPTEPSWGAMLSQNARRWMLVQPNIAIWPGVAITIAVFSWNLLGDALRDLWDPRLRGSQ